MLKIIGLMGLILASGLIGIVKSKDLKRRVSLLEDYLQMVIEIKGKINYFREPLPDIFGKANQNGNSKAFCLLGELQSELEEKDGDIVKIWPQKVNDTYKSEPLHKEDLEIFKYPGEFIGQTDFDNHIYHFSYLEDKLKKQIKQAEVSLEQKGPMYNKIGFFLGAIGAILLI